MVSHFDHPWLMDSADVAAIDRLSRHHPNLKWTHLYNPVAYTQPTPLRQEMEALVKASRESGGEIGVHTHMYRSLVEAAGVTFRNHPSAASRVVAGSVDDTGYAVPTTAYSEDEIAKILRYTIELFEQRGLGRPRTFCAGFWATSVALQRTLVQLEFTTSAAAMPVGSDYEMRLPGACFELFGWDKTVTHLTPPYAVSATSILPGSSLPYLTSRHGPLIEIPQTCMIDLMIELEGIKQIVAAHYDETKSGTDSAVCLAIHEENAAEVVDAYDDLLRFVDSLAANSGDVDVRYATCTTVSRAFARQMEAESRPPE